MVTGQEQTIAELAPRVKNVLDLHTQQIVGLRSDINTLSNKMNIRFDEVHAKIDTLKSEMNTKLDLMNTKIDDSVVGLQDVMKANQTHTELMMKQMFQELIAAMPQTTSDAVPSIVVDNVDEQRAIDATREEMRSTLNNTSRKVQGLFNNAISLLRPLRPGRPLSRVCLHPNFRDQLVDATFIEYFRFTRVFVKY